MFEPPPWCMAVKAHCPEALPNVVWQPPTPRRELFGFRQYYHHPSRPNAGHNFNARLIADENIELFTVEGSMSAQIICEVCPENFEVIAVLPFHTGRAFEIYQANGWEGLRREARLTYFPKQQALATAA